METAVCHVTGKRRLVALRYTVGPLDDGAAVVPVLEGQRTARHRRIGLKVDSVSLNLKGDGPCGDAGAVAIGDRTENGPRLVAEPGRSEDRRVGNECVRTCRSRGSPDH